MKNCMITFRSVTPAQRAEETLRRAGVGCRIQRTPKWMEEKGCGYSIRMDCKDIIMAVSLLRQENIQFRKVYAVGDNGSTEELYL